MFQLQRFILLQILIISSANYVIQDLNLTCFGKCFCSLDRSRIHCENFYSFTELNFLDEDPSSAFVTWLYLKPENRTALDNDLSLSGLNFNRNTTVITLVNINGVKLSTNTFQESLKLVDRAKLIIDNPYIFFYNDLKLNSDPIFSSFVYIYFGRQNVYNSAE